MREKGGNLFASGLRIYERLGPANPEDDEVDMHRGNPHMATGPTHIWNHDKAAKERKRKATHQVGQRGHGLHIPACLRVSRGVSSFLCLRLRRKHAGHLPHRAQPIDPEANGRFGQPPLLPAHLQKAEDPKPGKKSPVSGRLRAV